MTMFGLFKRKKEKQQEEGIEALSDAEQALFKKGDELLAAVEGPWEYLLNVSTLIQAKAREIELIELFGHIHTCTQIGAPAMVSTLCQVAIWRLSQSDEHDKEVIAQFAQLAVTSTVDMLNWCSENNQKLVYQ